MAISSTDARGLFTKKVIEVYKEVTKPSTFLRSFFKVKESVTKEISIEVQRNSEKIAVDVERGTEGNRNAFGKSTEKIFIPPYYREYFDATQLDLYDRAIGSSDSGVMVALVEDAAEKLMSLKDKIDRAYELQVSQVLQTGIVTLSSGINIDFKRKAGSLVDLGTINSNRYWSVANNATATVFEDIENGCIFLRKFGKSGDGTFNVIFGDEALAAFLSMAQVQDRGDIANITLDAIKMPNMSTDGACFHGQTTAGSYKINIWTYPQFYDNSSNVSTPYINPKNIIVIPTSPRFTLGFAAVPQLLNGTSVPQKGAYVINEYLDERNANHIFDIKSAGVAIPTAVDCIYTAKVIAG
jgi:hypothetical protein